jgi:hypothetical protein
MRRFLCGLALSLFLAGLCTTAVHGTSYNWDTTNGNWSVATNWNPVTGPPVAGDDTTFNNANSGYTVTIDDPATSSIKTISVSDTDVIFDQKRSSFTITSSFAGAAGGSTYVVNEDTHLIFSGGATVNDVTIRLNGGLDIAFLETSGGSGGVAINSGSTISVVGSGANAGEIDLSTDFTNNGTISFKGSSSPFLYVSLDAGKTFTNNGSIQANQNDSKVEIVNNGTFTNTGTLSATNGGTIQIDDTGNFSNYNSGTKTLTGGTYFVGTESVINLVGATILTLGDGATATKVTLDGASPTFSAIQGNLLTVTKGATLELSNVLISGTHTFTSGAGDFNNAGTINIKNTDTTFKVASGGVNTLKINSGGVVNLDPGAKIQGLVEVNSGGKLLGNGNHHPDADGQQ